MEPDRYDEILAELLEAAEGGREVALDEIVAKHPGHEATARHVLGDLARYKRLSSSASTRRPLLVDSLKRGERLGDFEIDEALASGGMGFVYRARQLSLGNRRVALKVLPVESANVRDRARFEREALALAGLHHPHLAEVFGFGEERGCLFFAMRLVNGPNVRDVLERRASERRRDDVGTRRELVARIAEVAEALAVVHSAGLVHRDVKPSNIVLEGANATATNLAGSAVLVDFGLVRPIDKSAATLTGDSPATLSYAPPEQLLGRDIDSRADVFALGVTLHDLLAARTPHERMQASVGLEAIDTLVPDIDQDLAAIVGKAVDPEADWRYANASVLLADLRAWLAGKSVSARRPSALERARRWSARHPRAIARAAGLALAVVVLAIAAAGLTRFADAASKAKSALARGDVVQLFESLHNVPHGLRWVLLRDHDLVLLASRADARATGDPLSAIHDALARRDTPSALFEAATHLRLRGADADPHVRDFLVAALRGTNAPDDSRTRDAYASLTALVVGRLYNERLDESPRDVGFSAPLRSAVLQRLADRALDRTSKLNLWTALSGCGKPTELDDLLAQAAVPEQSEEERRLALWTAERIVRRAHACMTLREIDFDACWRRYGPLLEALTDDRTEFSSDVRAALEALHRAMAFACRAAFEPWDPERAFCRAWLSRLDVARVPAHGSWLAVVGALHARRTLAALVDPPSIELLTNHSQSVAEALVYYGDRELVEATRARCAALGTGVLASYERGLARMERERRGEELEPSVWDWTKLGATRERRGLQGIACDRIESPEYRDSSDFGLEVTGDWLKSLAAGGAGRVLALWRFDGLLPSVGGGAAGTAAESCEVKRLESNDSYLLFDDFGQSRVDLMLRFASTSNRATRKLVLWHMVGARSYCPFLGEVRLDLRVNDTLLDDRLLVRYGGGPSFASLDVGELDLRTGKNVISIRLHETSTTTYRLIAAELREL